MNEKKKLVPKLRFPEFTDDWEQRKLGEVVKIIMGQSPNSKNYTDNSNDHILVQGNADMKNGRVCPRVWTTQVTKQAEKNDLILSVRAPVGDVGKTDYDVVLGRGVAGIKGNEYIFQLLTKMKENGYWRNLSTGSTFESINLNDIKEAYVLNPTKKEQEKIGDFFKDIDKLITLHQRKLEDTKKLKKGLLQKMFPKNGEKVPEVRFPEFTDDWEQRKALDIGEYFKGNGYSKSDLTTVGTPIILYGRLYTNYEFLISEVDTFVKLKDNSIYSIGNEVIIPASGESSEDIARASAVKKSGVLLGGDLNIIRPLDFIDSLFLAINFSNGEVQKSLAKRAQGKSVVHIRNSDIQEVLVSYPKLKEQEKIGKFFRDIDNLITLHQRKLDNLEKQKKALLQQMFV